MKDIPTKIKIGGFNFEIVQESKDTNAGGFVGLCQYDQLRISLANNYPKQRIEACFLHEILHACFHNTSLDSVKEISANEEHIIDALSTALYQVLRDNKLDFSQDEKHSNY